MNLPLNRWLVNDTTSADYWTYEARPPTVSPVIY